MGKAPFQFRPFDKCDRSPDWVPEEQMLVTISMSRTRFNRLKNAGRPFKLSMRQVVSQMLTYAEENMSND